MAAADSNYVMSIVQNVLFIIYKSIHSLLLNKLHEPEFKYNGKANFSTKDLNEGYTVNDFSVLDVYLNEKGLSVKIQLLNIFKNSYIKSAYYSICDDYDVNADEIWMNRNWFCTTAYRKFGDGGKATQSSKPIKKTWLNKATPETHSVKCPDDKSIKDSPAAQHGQTISPIDKLKILAENHNDEKLAITRLIGGDGVIAYHF